MPKRYPDEPKTYNKLLIREINIGIVRLQQKILNMGNKVREIPVKQRISDTSHTIILI